MSGFSSASYEPHPEAHERLGGGMNAVTLPTNQYLQNRFDHNFFKVNWHVSFSGVQHSNMKPSGLHIRLTYIREGIKG